MYGGVVLFVGTDIMIYLKYVIEVVGEVFERIRLFIMHNISGIFYYNLKKKIAEVG